MTQKEAENPHAPLEGPVWKLTQSLTITLGSGRGWSASRAYGEGLGCLVPEQGLKGQLPLLLLPGPSLGRSADMLYLACVELSPCIADSDGVLAGEIHLLHFLSPQNTTLPKSQIAHGWPVARETVPPSILWDPCSHGRRQPPACFAHVWPAHCRGDF